MPSSQIQLTMQVSEAMHVYLLYNDLTMLQHNEKRPWITSEKWAHSDLLTGHAGRIKLTSADCDEVTLGGLLVKTFAAGKIDIMGNNGHGENGPLIFIVKAGSVYKCECCLDTKPSNEYATKKPLKLICFRCQRLGFSYRDFTKYSCACNDEPLGHLRFETMDLANWKRGKTKELHCRICKQEDPHKRNKEPHNKFQCRVCGIIAKGEDTFGTNILFNHRYHGRNLICTNCQERGLSLHDYNTYICKICRCEAGHLRFVKNTLKSFRQRQVLSPICKSCWAKGDRVLRLLRRKDAWRCKCKVHKQSRARNTSAHTEPRCPLHPQVRFKKKCQGWNFHLAKKCQAQGISSKWEGKNVGIAWSDLEMLWEMNRF